MPDLSDQPPGPIRFEKEESGREGEKWKDPEIEEPVVEKMKCEGPYESNYAGSLPEEEESDAQVEEDPAIGIGIDHPVFSQKSANPRMKICLLSQPYPEGFTLEPVAVQFCHPPEEINDEDLSPQEEECPERDSGGTKSEGTQFV